MAALFLPFTSRIADGLSNSRLGDMIHAQVSDPPAASLTSTWADTSQHPRLTASTWSLYIGAWRRNAANFANLPEHLQFRPPPASERKPTVPPTPTPTSLPPAATKRPASEESSAPTDLQGKKQKRSTAYTEEEEMAMAAHIFGRLPTPTAFRLADWVDFQKDVSQYSWRTSSCEIWGAAWLTPRTAPSEVSSSICRALPRLRRPY